MRRPAHRSRRVHRHHLAGHQPVEQVAHGGEVLLHARRSEGAGLHLDPGGDVQRLHPGVRAPSEELPARAAVGPAGVAVADGDGEELQEAARSLVAGGGDQRRHDRRVLGSWRHPGLRDQGRGLRAHPRGRMMLPGGTQASRCSR
jgi:hypothetical protein